MDAVLERAPGRLDRDRLARILGMLGSAHDGEVLAAARTAERIRRDAGSTWAEILQPVPPLAAAAEAEIDADPIGFCLGHAELLTDWERRFLISIRRQDYPLTGRQLGVLRKLVGKCWGAAP
jgi:hypothetical protein